MWFSLFGKVEGFFLAQSPNVRVVVVVILEMLGFYE